MASSVDGNRYPIPLNGCRGGCTTSPNQNVENCEEDDEYQLTSIPDDLLLLELARRKKMRIKCPKNSNKQNKPILHEIFDNGNNRQGMSKFCTDLENIHAALLSRTFVK